MPNNYTHGPEIEEVELSADGLDAIADAVVDRWSTKAGHRPNRTQFPGEAGIVEKPGSKSVYTGGDDQYTLTGRTHADRAVNLFLASTILSTPDPRTGQPYRDAFSGKALLSDRLRDVMLGAAEKAMHDPAPEIPEDRDPDGFITSSVRGLRADAMKAMSSTGTNAGDEWVPTFAASQMWADVHLRTEVGGVVPRIDMPTNPFDIGTITADPTFYYASSENTAVTASDATTNKAILTAKKIQCEVDFSGELTEDSIIPLLPNLRAVLVRRAAQTIDDLIVSGDTTTAGTGNVNSDDAAPAANSAYLALDGMRKFCITTNTGQLKSFASAPTTTLWNNVRALLGKYGARPSDVFVVMPTSTSIAFQDVTGFKLVSEYGPNATVLTGELGKIFGCTVLGYETIPGASTDKVDADGKYTTTTPASNDTKGFLVAFNRTQWYAGFRRGITVESWRDIKKDQNILVCSMRMALIPSGIATTHTAVGYNITVG